MLVAAGRSFALPVSMLMLLPRRLGDIGIFYATTVSEALTLLPVVSGAAVPGLAVGCLLGNLTSPYGLVDIVCGTCASLLAAVGARPDAGRLSRPTAGFSRLRCKRRRKNV